MNTIILQETSLFDGDVCATSIADNTRTGQPVTFFWVMIPSQKPTVAFYG
jgi:hypothetical protein